MGVALAFATVSCARVRPAEEKLVGILMSQAPSTRIHTRMLYKDLVYGAVVE